MAKKPQIPPSRRQNDSRRRQADRYVEKIAEILSDNPDQSKIDPLFLGRAGEMFVAAHLLRLGLNASPLPVDTGVDLLAHLDLKFDPPLLEAQHEIYQFQIKTTATNEYRASIPVRKLHDLWHKTINLVVVFWGRDTDPAAVVIPPSLARMFTSGGFEDPRSPFLANRDRVSLRIIQSKGRYFIRNLANDITEMCNRFDRVEPIGTNTDIFPGYASWVDGKGLVRIEPV